MKLLPCIGNLGFHNNHLTSRSYPLSRGDFTTERYHMKETLTVAEVAKRLGVNPQTVRIGLQRDLYPFGYAVRSITGNGWRYVIPTQKFNEYMGVKDERDIRVCNCVSSGD